jgi:uncharacterized protein YoxC
VTSDSYPALGFDPAPGTVNAVQSLAENLTKVATDIGQAHDQLENIGKDKGIWQGKAAQAFQRKVGPLPDYLHKANESLGDAGKVLGQWGNDLSSLQQNARNYEAEAQRALQQLKRAQGNPDLKLAGQHFQDQAALRQAQSKLDAAEQAVNKANEELESIQQQAKRLLRQHDELVQDVVKALNKAKDEAIPPPGLFERIGQALSDLGNSIKDTASKAWDFIKQHANDIAKIGDILSDVGGVLSIATIATAEIPVVGEVVGAAAITVEAAALATHGLAKAAGANVSWTKMGFDALGTIPGGGAINSELGILKAAPRLARAVTKGGKGIESLGQVTEDGGKVISRLSNAQMAKWSGTFDKVAGKVSGAFGKEIPEAGSKIGGIAVGTAQKVGTDLGLKAADPYLHRTEDQGKAIFKDITQGKPLPSAGHVFHSVVRGSAA